MKVNFEHWTRLPQWYDTPPLPEGFDASIKEAYPGIDEFWIEAFRRTYRHYHFVEWYEKKVPPDYKTITQNIETVRMHAERLRRACDRLDLREKAALDGVLMDYSGKEVEWIENGEVEPFVLFHYMITTLVEAIDKSEQISAWRERLKTGGSGKYPHTRNTNIKKTIWLLDMLLEQNILFRPAGYTDLQKAVALIVRDRGEQPKKEAIQKYIEERKQLTN